MRCSLLTLSSYLDDELDAAHRAECEAHLVGCQRCHDALEYLREEVSRLSGLGRMHLPDAAARALLVQLGLAAEEDDLPPRSPHAAPEVGDAPPWLAASVAGTALPWTPRREPVQAPGFPPPAGPDQPSPLFPPGRPSAAPPPPPPPPPAPSGWSASLEDGPLSSRRTDAELDLSGRSIPAAGPPSGVLQPASARLEQPASGDSGPLPLWPARLAHEEPGEVGHLATETSPAPPRRAGAPLPDHPAPSRPAAPAADPPATRRAEPWDWAAGFHPLRDSPGPDLGVADEDLVEADEPALRIPAGGELPDPFGDSLVGRAARSPQPLRPGLLSRVRDQMALRLALARPAGDAEAEADWSTGIDRRPAAGTQTRPHPAARPARPVGDSAPPGASAFPDEAEQAPPRVARIPGRATTAEELLPGAWADEAEAAPSSARATGGGSGRHTRGLGRRAAGWDVRGFAAGLVARLAPAPGSRPGTRLSRRWIAVAAAVLLVAILLLVISLTGHQAPVATVPSTAPTAAASAAPSPPQASAHATAAPTAAATATPAPTPTPAPSSAVQTSSWQLSGVTCCYVQQGTGYTRVIFYLSGGATAAPTVAVTQPSSTSLVLTLQGVAASGSPQLGSGGIVTSMTQSPGSSVAFHLTFSRAATVKGWDFLARGDSSTSSPLLYYDLGSIG